MSIISKSALISNIGSAQLKLFDNYDVETNFEKRVEKFAIGQSKTENINKNINILENGHYEMIKPICPHCKSLEQTKQGFREINPTIDNGEKIKISLQRYKCKSCGKKYSTSIKNVKEENKSFLKSLKDRIRESKRIRGGSLRKIAKDVMNFLNIGISHQSIKNFLKIDENHVTKEVNRLTRKFKQLSGFLIIVEEHLYINGKKRYRVSLHDLFIKGPIAEEIMNKITSEKIKALIEEVTDGNEIISLTSDGLRQYKSVAKD